MNNPSREDAEAMKGHSMTHTAQMVAQALQVLRALAASCRLWYAQRATKSTLFAVLVCRIPLRYMVAGADAKIRIIGQPDL